MDVVTRWRAELSVHITTHKIIVSYQCDTKQLLWNDSGICISFYFGPGTLKIMKDFEDKKIILCLLFSEIGMHSEVCVQKIYDISI